jgi:hypothetical protein
MARANISRVLQEPTSKEKARGCDTLSEIEKIGGQKPLLRLKEPVPDFEATTTQGKIKLSQYRGKSVTLFSL